MGCEGLDIFNTFDVDTATCTLDDVIKLFDEHFHPLKNETFERYKFWSRNQHESEPIDNYVTTLRNLASTCGFDQQKDKMLRDKIVFGINDNSVKE